MLRTPIQVVSFDAAGTLIHLAEDVGTSYSRVASHHGIAAKASSLNGAFHRVWKRTSLPFSEKASHPDPDEKSWWRRLVREVFEEAGAFLPEQGKFDDFFESLYLHFESPGTWVPDPAAHEVIEKVSASYRCVVLSNFDARLRRILDDLGLLSSFERVFLSCEMGMSKPDPRLFQRVCESLEVEPQTILHVGDDPDCDWGGSESAGLRSFRVGRGGDSLAGLLRELSLA